MPASVVPSKASPSTVVAVKRSSLTAAGSVGFGEGSVAELLGASVESMAAWLGVGSALLSVLVVQAILEAGGGHNAMVDLKDTWTEVPWESLAASKPDAFVFVDYPGQTFAQKVAVLKANPATRDLPAVKEDRFLNLPYAMWTSGPLNIDAAEEVRSTLEKWGMVPTS